MPELGETGSGYRLGMGNKSRQIWQACPDCGRERWVALIRGKPISTRCRVCARVYSNKKRRYSGEDNPNWKGGRAKTGQGYIKALLYPDDFFYPMVDKSGYVMEHRLVVARALGRCLLSWEVVHHKGTKYPKGSIENKSDNRYPENLELLPTDKFHIVDRITRSLIARLGKRVTLLEAENVLLREQIKSLGEDIWKTTTYKSIYSYEGRGREIEPRIL